MYNIRERNQVIKQTIQTFMLWLNFWESADSNYFALCEETWVLNDATGGLIEECYSVEQVWAC